MPTIAELTTLVNQWKTSVDSKSENQSELESKVCDAVQEMLRGDSGNGEMKGQTVQVLNDAQFTTQQKRCIYQTLFGGNADSIIVDRCIESNRNFDGFDKMITLPLEDESIEISLAELRGMGGYFEDFANNSANFGKSEVLAGLNIDEFNLIRQFYLDRDVMDFTDPDTWLYMHDYADRFRLEDLSKALPGFPSFATVDEAIDFASNKNLKVLDLSAFGNSVTDDHLEKIRRLIETNDPQKKNQGLINLEKLVILSSKITDAGLAHLAALKELRVLHLSWCELITDAGLAHLEVLKELRVLHLSWCSLIKDAGLAHLEALKELRELNLSGCELITDAGLAHLAALKELRVLNFNSCERIRDAGLAHLAALKELRELDLSWCQLITDAGLAHLEVLKELRVLHLSSCEPITDAGLAHLAALKELRELDLSGCSLIKDAGLAHLAALKELRVLNLSGCSLIKDAGLAHLAALKELRVLHLIECELITDAGLAYLAALKELRVLALDSCELITDAGLSHLAALNELRVLDLIDCNKITENAIHSLKLRGVAVT